MRGTKLLIACVAMLVATAGQVQAGLMLSVTDAGGGNTRWVFSGSTVSLHTENSTNSFWGRNWSPASPTPTSTTSGNSAILSGSGSFFSTTSGTHAATDVWTQNTFTTQIGPRFSFVSWNIGDTLSWSGDLIAAVDISTLNAGTYTTNELYDGFISENLVVTIGSVPEPTSLAIFGIGALGMVVRHRRKRKRT